ncbi:hypothetical protein L6R52_04040 [Myxococcota bacterium]|nr:hypothetical protein [Myxococcota bacterium]
MLRTIVPILALVVTFGSGCAGHRLVAPQTPPMAAVRPDLSRFSVALRSFDATNQSELDVAEGSKRGLERAFMEYLSSAAELGALTGPARTPADGSIEVDVFVRVSEDENRTYVLDALFFYPFMGTFPLTPLWGHATVEATLSFRGTADEAPEPPITVKVVAPYSVIFYSFYRPGPLEDAYRRAHDAAFRQLVEALVVRLQTRERRARAEEAEALARARTSTTATATTAIAAAPDEDSTETNAAGAPKPEELALLVKRPPEPSKAAALGIDTSASALRPAHGTGELVRLDPEPGINVVFEPFRRDHEDPSLVWRWASSLGGLEASLTRGFATVQSRARTESGFVETVGSGDATSRGYRFSMYQPPDRTGIFFPPVLGFLSQTIDISGFREDVPLFAPEGSDTIPAVASDPATGLPVDPAEPIAYGLDLKSGYVGQGIGVNLVIGTEDVQLFSTVKASINLFEVRHTDVRLYQSRVEGMSVAAFQSGAVGGQLGLAIRPLHLAVRTAFQFEWFNEFDYPKPLEFQASSAFDWEKQIFERQRVFVEGAGLKTFDWQVSVVALF